VVTTALGAEEVDALSEGDAGIAIFSVVVLLIGLVLVVDLGKFGTRSLQALRGDDDGSSGDSTTRKIVRWTSPGWSFYRRMPDWSMRAGGLFALPYPS